MKLIIAGGRDYDLTVGDFSSLMDLMPRVTEVVSGGATGVDQQGEMWADFYGFPIKRFPADWRTHGKAAGPIRNAEMAAYADAVALFPGGRGTASMRREAEKAGIEIFDLTNAS